MSRVAPLARERSITLPRLSDRTALGTCAIFGVALLAISWQAWGDPNGDSGYDIVAGSRLADGQLPYADFTYYYGPFAPAVAAIGTLVGGRGLTPAVVTGVLLAVLIAGATYLLARRLVGTLGALLATCLTIAVALQPDNFSYILPYTLDAPLGTLALLALILAAERAAATQRGAWLAATGAAAGLAALTKPEFTLAAWTALAGLAALRLRRPRELALLLVPALAVPAIVYGAFLGAVSLHDLIYTNLYPVDTLKAGGDEILKARMPLTVTSVVKVLVRLGLYAAGCVALVAAAAAIERRGRLRRPLLVAIGVAGALALVGIFVAPEALRHGLQFAYGWIPAGAVVAVVVLVARGRREGWDAERQGMLAGALALVGFAATTYNGFFFQATNPQTAVFAAPLVAVLLARLHLVELARSAPETVLGAGWLAFLVLASAGLVLHDARAETATVSGPGGTLRAAPAAAPAIQGAIDAITRNTRSGDPVLVVPYLSSVYALTERRDFVPEIVIQPVTYPTPADEERLVALLRTERPAIVVTTRREFPAYAAGHFGSGFAGRIADQIRATYRPIGTVQGVGPTPLTIDLWQRIGAP